MRPKILSNAEAAALPLMLLRASVLTSGHLLIMGAAGGVGSTSIQLAPRLMGLGLGFRLLISSRQGLCKHSAFFQYHEDFVAEVDSFLATNK